MHFYSPSLWSFFWTNSQFIPDYWNPSHHFTPAQQPTQAPNSQPMSLNPDKWEKERMGKSEAGGGPGFLRGIPVTGVRTRPFLFWANQELFQWVLCGSTYVEVSATAWRQVHWWVCYTDKAMSHQKG